MKLYDVLRKERARRSLSVEEMALQSGLSADEYSRLESSDSLEESGLKLSQIAITLKTPTSRLISETGKSAQAKQEASQCGKLIRSHRERSGLTQEELAGLIGIPVAEVASIEDGKSLLEEHGPFLLRFAETVSQPVFNLFYPHGLPLHKLTDYQ
jgi:transcriptional regulator with XRE-family HTH domain